MFDLISAVLGVLLYIGLGLLIFMTYDQFLKDVRLSNFLIELGLFVAMIIDVTALYYANPILPKELTGSMFAVSILFSFTILLSIMAWGEKRNGTYYRTDLNNSPQPRFDTD